MYINSPGQIIKSFASIVCFDFDSSIDLETLHFVLEIAISNFELILFEGSIIVPFFKRMS